MWKSQEQSWKKSRGVGNRLKNVNKIHEKTRESVKSRGKLGKRTAKKSVERPWKDEDKRRENREEKR